MVVAVFISARCATSDRGVELSFHLYFQAATTLNTTVSATVASDFEVLFNATAGKTPNTTAFYRFTNDEENPDAAPLVLWNIGARDCSDYDNCIGVLTNGTCVCYQQQNFL